eukprot:6464621-Pyramimonas_sp.AAC.1
MLPYAGPVPLRKLVTHRPGQCLNGAVSGHADQRRHPIQLVVHCPRDPPPEVHDHPTRLSLIHI